MRLKVLVISVFLIHLVSTGNSIVCASFDSPLHESIYAQLEELELDQVLRYIDLLDSEYGEFVPSLDFSAIITGNSSYPGGGELLKLLVRSLLREVYVSSHLLRQLVLVAVLSALLHRLGMSFGEKTVVDLAFGICFLVLIFIGLQSFRTALSLAQETIDNMVSFMYSLLPLMSALLAAVGGVTSAAIFHPILISVIGTIAWVVRYFLFPLIFTSAVLGIISNFSTEFPMSRLAGLFRQITVTSLGVLFIVFLGVMVVRGAIAPIADGITLRAAKFFAKTFVPVVGSMFADAAEVVIGGSLLIKNSVGVFGLVMIFFFVAMPIVKVWAIVLVYKLVGALIEPICDKRLVNALTGLEGSLTLVLVALATVALMFFMAITILVSMGNLAVVMR